MAEMLTSWSSLWDLVEQRGALAGAAWRAFDKAAAALAAQMV